MFYVFKTVSSIKTLRLGCLTRFSTYTAKTPPRNSLDVNTNVTKDVIIYKYENPRFYKVLNIFAACQFLFWSYVSYLAYTTLRDVPVSSTDGQRWWQRINLGETRFRYGITTSTFLIGYGILVISWMYTLRSVRYLVLRKGGNSISFVTYTPFGENRIMTVPMQHISCQEMRRNARSQLPIKIQNRFLYYIVDMKGDFKNTALFDNTVGLKRTFKE